MQDAHGIILGDSRVDLLTYATSSKLKTGLISMSLAGASFSQESRSAKRFQRNEWTEKPYVASPFQSLVQLKNMMDILSCQE